MFNHYSNSYPLRKTLFHWFIIFFSHNFHQSLYTSCFFFIGCYTISYRKISPTSMATTAVCFCVALSLATFFALSPVAVSSISASPPVSPHRTYQNMSSFFPSVDEHSSPISADPASAPGSGEFMGKSGSSDVKLNHGVSAFGLSICTKSHPQLHKTPRNPTKFIHSISPTNLLSPSSYPPPHLSRSSNLRHQTPHETLRRRRSRGYFPGCHFGGSKEIVHWEYT